MKLERKEREGGRVRRVYDEPATPYVRVLASAGVSRAQKATLRAQRAQLNPFALHRQIEKELRVIYATARVN